MSEKGSAQKKAAARNERPRDVAGVGGIRYTLLPGRRRIGMLMPMAMVISRRTLASWPAAVAVAARSEALV
jgi:hypothetical protein